MARQRMTGVLRTLLSNLGSMILALLLAVAVWIAATLQADPFAVQQYTGLPVVPINQPENTLLYQGDETSVAVTIRAAQSVLDELNAQDLRAVVDLSSVDVGVEAVVPITVTVADEGVRVMSLNPEAQTVRLEALGTLTLPVQIDVVGQVPIGYQAANLDVNPANVRVFGPVPALEQVNTITGTIDVTGARDDVSQRVSIAPRNVAGEVVAGLEWEPDVVQVSLDIQRRVGYKPEVEVVPDLRGEPAAGHRRGSVSVLPSTVTLAGPTSVLNSLPSFVKTLPVTITNAANDLTMRVPLTVPNSVVVVETNFVTVNVEILPILSSRSFTGSVEFQGLRSGYQATVSPQMVEVVLEGPETQLDELNPEDLRVYVNLSGYGLGTYRVDPLVLAPPNVRVVNIIPESVEVRIELIPPPTPVSIPLATATPQP
ncbi:MAG: CdaR family protein [Anaerolineae bacterium]|nr:CdaR family protein [Anaerolineae bacterium]